MALITEQDDILLADESIVDRNLLSVVFISLNWLIFGFSLCHDSNSNTIFTESNILSIFQSQLYSMLLPLGGLIGSLLTGTCLKQIFGYKHTTLLGGLLNVLAWFCELSMLAIDARRLTAISSVVLVSRFLNGISCGILVIVVPVYVSQSALLERRFAFNMLPPFFLSLGMFFFRTCSLILLHIDSELSYVSLTLPQVDFTTYRLTLSYIPVIGIVLSLVVLTLSLFAVEDYENEDWHNVVMHSLYDPMIDEHFSLTEMIYERFSFLRQKHIQRELLTALVLMSFQQLCGFNTIISHGGSMIANSLTTPSSVPVTILTARTCLISAFLYLIGTLLSLILSRYIPRKPILYTCSFVIFITNLIITMCIRNDMLNSTWIGFLSVFFVISFSCSWGTFPWLLISEIFAHEMKCFGIMFSTMTMWIYMLFMGVTYIPVLNISHVSGMFIFYAIFAIFSILAIKIFIPETGRKTVEEIQNMFKESYT